MGIRGIVTLNLNFAPMLEATKAAILAATQDLFEEDIVPTAKDLSPVTEEGYERNVEQKKKQPSGTGTNRRSIDSEVNDGPDGPHAELFTQSGYGGYLELGTSKMRAQPYLNPAFDQHIGKLPEKVKEKMAAQGGGIAIAAKAGGQSSE